MKRYQWRPQLEAKYAALEREADALLQADARRQRAAHQSKPKPKQTPLPLPPVSGGYRCLIFDVHYEPRIPVTGAPVNKSLNKRRGRSWPLRYLSLNSQS